MRHLKLAAACLLLIIGLLSVVSIDPVGRNEQAKTVATQVQIQQFHLALDMYKEDVGAYPSTEEGLEALRLNPCNYRGWRGPYLRTDVPTDPWGLAYRYQFTEGQPPQISSISLQFISP